MRQSIVLNAFRHQRIRNLFDAIDSGDWLECSTPFGINVFGTLFDAIDSGDWLECSTPFGINVFGTGSA